MCRLEVICWWSKKSSYIWEEARTWRSPRSPLTLCDSIQLTLQMPQTCMQGQEPQGLQLLGNTNFPPAFLVVSLHVLFPLLPNALLYFNHQTDYSHLSRFSLRVKSIPKRSIPPSSPSSLLPFSVSLSTLCSSSQHTGFSWLVLYPISTTRSRQRPDLVRCVSPVFSVMPGIE